MSETARAYRVNESQVAIWCPGCHTAHVLDGRWIFNGDYERPTFSPSLKCWHPRGDGEDSDVPAYVCHTCITDGRIQFLGDCTHSLANQTVDIPPWRGFGA